MPTMIEDGKPSIPVYVGILVGLLASFVQSLGVCLLGTRRAERQ